MSLSLVAVGSLTSSGGQFVAGYVDAAGVSKLYITTGGAPSVANSLPSTVSTAQTTQVDSAGTSKVGGWVVKIAAAAADTTNISSPLNVYLDQEAYFIVASTNNG